MSRVCDHFQQILLFLKCTFLIKIYQKQAFFCLSSIVLWRWPITWALRDICSFIEACFLLFFSSKSLDGLMVQSLFFPKEQAGTRTHLTTEQVSTFCPSVVSLCPDKLSDVPTPLIYDFYICGFSWWQSCMTVMVSSLGINTHFSENITL